MIHTDVKSFLQDIASFLLSLLPCSFSTLSNFSSNFLFKEWSWENQESMMLTGGQEVEMMMVVRLFLLYALLVCFVCFNLWQVFTVDERNLLMRRGLQNMGSSSQLFFFLSPHFCLTIILSILYPPVGNLWLFSLSIKLFPSIVGFGVVNGCSMLHLLEEYIESPFIQYILKASSSISLVEESSFINNMGE